VILLLLLGPLGISGNPAIGWGQESILEKGPKPDSVQELPSPLDKAFESSSRLEERRGEVTIREGDINWNGLEKFRLDLKLPLLIIRGSRGVLASDYLNVETFNNTDDVGALVTGVKTFEDMLNARVTGVSVAAEQAGIRPGMTGAEVIEHIR